MQISLSGFADKINEIMPSIAREFMKRQPNELYKIKITLPQLFILDFLSRSPESRMTDLSRFMNVTTAAMTGLVDRLVRCGYVQRIYEPHDRRIIKIKLIAKGSELAKKINQQRRQMIIHAFGKISQKEREDYLRILMRIYEMLTKEK